MRIVVVDDHPLVWQGIKAVLSAEPDMELAGWAANGREAERQVIEQKPDIVLMDMRLPGESGLEIIRRLRPKVPASRFVILTTYSEQRDVAEAVNMGVEGYILKEALPEEMLAALRLVAKGRPYFDPVIMQMMLEQRSQQHQLEELTERELEVLQQLAQGLSNREIARNLYVTEYTVKKHVSGILSKLRLKDRTQAALYAVSTCLVRAGSS